MGNNQQGSPSLACSNDQPLRRYSPGLSRAYMRLISTIFAPVRWGLLGFMWGCPPPPSSFLLPPSVSSLILFPPPGPQLQALDRRVPCRTSTAGSGSECSPLEGKLIRVFPAGPQPQAPDQSVPRRTSTTNLGRYTRYNARSNDVYLARYVGGHCRTSTARSRSQWALPHLNQDRKRKRRRGQL